MTRTQERYFYIVIILFFIGASLHYFMSVGLFFPMDDAYIVLHNVQVLKDGIDQNFYVPPTLGSTSLIQLALVTLLSFIVPTPLIAQYLLMWLAIFSYAAGVVRLASLLKASLFQAILLTVTALAVGEIAHQLLNGLETGLALAAIVWVIILAINHKKRQTWLLPAFCGQLPFIRPELIVLSGLFMAWCMYRSWKTRSCSGQAIGHMVRDALFFLVSSSPWLAWSYLATGSLIPNTIHAKRYFFGDHNFPIITKAAWVYKGCTTFLGIVGFLSLAIVFLLVTDIGIIGLLFILIFMIVYSINSPRMLYHNEFRYMYIAIPFFLYSVMTGIKHKYHLIQYTAKLILILSTTLSLLWFVLRYHEHLKGVSFTKIELSGVADWCNANLPPDAKLLIHDAGYISWATKFRMVDFVGLKTPSCIPYHYRITEPSMGDKRGQAVHEIAMSFKPDYLIMLDEWDIIFKITSGLRENGWTLTPLRGNNNGLWKYYEVYSLSHQAKPLAPR